MEFHIKKSQFSAKSLIKESKCADRGHSLNRDFTVQSGWLQLCKSPAVRLFHSVSGMNECTSIEYSLVCLCYCSYLVHVHVCAMCVCVHDHHVCFRDRSSQPARSGWFFSRSSPDSYLHTYYYPNEHYDGRTNVPSCWKSRFTVMKGLGQNTLMLSRLHAKSKLFNVKFHSGHNILYLKLRFYVKIGIRYIETLPYILPGQDDHDEEDPLQSAEQQGCELGKSSTSKPPSPPPPPPPYRQHHRHSHPSHQQPTSISTSIGATNNNNNNPQLRRRTSAKLAANHNNKQKKNECVIEMVDDDPARYQGTNLGYYSEW